MKKTGQDKDVNTDTRCYDDILQRERPVSLTHAPMPVADRAAQFAPFAALTGHGSVISEAYREHLAAGDGVEAIPVWEAEMNPEDPMKTEL